MTHPLSKDECNTDFPEVEGYLLTTEFLAQTAIICGERYHRHPNGGGWVADTAEVDVRFRVPPSKRVGPMTLLVDDKNLASLYIIEGDMSLDSAGRTPISRRLPDVDIPLRLM